MQYGAPLGFVDRGTCEHRFALGGDAGLIEQGKQQITRGCVDIGLGIVQNHIACRGAEIIRTGGIQQGFETPRSGRRMMGAQVVPDHLCLRPMHGGVFQHGADGGVLRVKPLRLIQCRTLISANDHDMTRHRRV